MPIESSSKAARPFRIQGANVICFSTADWDTLLPTNKHQVMRRLAALGSRVLYLETLGTRAPKLSSGTDLGRIARRLSRSFEGPKKREKRLWTLSPLVRPKWKSSLDIQVNRVAFQLQIGGLLRHFRDAIAWVYSPYAIHLLDVVKPARVVYHMVDDLAAVPGADVNSLREAESRLLARADVVFCTERSLYDRAVTTARRAFFMPNVADYNLFSRAGDGASAALQRLRAIPHPRLVFSGNLAPHKVDLELMLKLAKRRRSDQIVLIGPRWEGAGGDLLDKLQREPNVHCLGHVPYEDLPGFLHEADVLLLPYVLNNATQAVSPLKLFEYLSVGKPVVSSPLPSVLPYKPVVAIAESLEQWDALLDHALAHRHEGAEQRRALARRHTWERRIEEMEKAIAALY